MNQKILHLCILQKKIKYPSTKKGLIYFLLVRILMFENKCQEIFNFWKDVQDSLALGKRLNHRPIWGPAIFWPNIPMRSTSHSFTTLFQLLKSQPIGVISAKLLRIVKASIVSFSQRVIPLWSYFQFPILKFLFPQCGQPPVHFLNSIFLTKDLFIVTPLVMSSRISRTLSFMPLISCKQKLSVSIRLYFTEFPFKLKIA